MPAVLRYAAFADPDRPGGGNPAGVVLDADGLTDADMQRIAADVGFSETAFLRADGGIRYFSPLAEVPFCGHATIATAVAVAARDGAGSLTFATPVGPVELETSRGADGVLRASFTSVEPRIEEFAPAVLSRLLHLLRIREEDLDPDLPPRIAYAGNRHPVLVLHDAGVFDGFTFDPAAVRALMDAEGWAGTVTVMLRAADTVWEARNLFPVGVITEDPATGSAAASFGGYLRELAAVDAPARVGIRQGRHVGRPSLLVVDIPAAGGITVSGTARLL
ncbi:PhzF family phenazine biosynthesis protein [Microbacterium sp. dk485]|uniref:PhzF family phenazine biosynthesis protein n=1 Tax=Microbacterium sp. dk485 TaxID=2560021 RepID=UPI0010738499|nr:PhzF family phenazine biosynthesis protein [Microbacterium sp. dk485]TFV85085.1 PhzF family phenazine biosynthesis protein [Microbacterium sp. dk485]